MLFSSLCLFVYLSITFPKTLADFTDHFRVEVDHKLDKSNTIKITTDNTTYYNDLVSVKILMSNKEVTITKKTTDTSKKDYWSIDTNNRSELFVILTSNQKTLDFTITEITGLRNKYSVNLPISLTMQGIIDDTKQNLYYLCRKDKLTHAYYYYITNKSYKIAIRLINTKDLIEPIELQSNGNTNIALYDVSAFSLPAEFTSFHILNEIMYYFGKHQYFMEYSLSKECKKYKESGNIVLNVQSATNFDNSSQLIITQNSTSILSVNSNFNGSTLTFSFSTSSFNIGVYDLKIFIKNNSHYYPVNEETIKIINSYKILSVSPSETSLPHFSITFESFFDYDDNKYYKIEQASLVTDINCNLQSGSTTVLECTIPPIFTTFSEGNATISIGVLTCDSNDLQPISADITFKAVNLLNAIFLYEFPEYPTVGDSNQFRMSTEYLYNLDNIISITFKVIDYRGESKYLNYTKDGDYLLQYNQATYDITLNLFYVTGDYIELIEIKDSTNTLTFQEGEYVFKHESPFVFICSPIIQLNTDNDCSIVVSKWSSISISQLSSIEITKPDNSKLTFCDSCDNTITLSTDKASIVLNLNSENYYTVSSITLEDGSSFENINDNYPKFIKDTTLALITNEIQFASQEDFTFYSSFPDNVYLFVNDIIAYPCSPLSGTTLKQCDIILDTISTQKLENFKFLFNNVYIILNNIVELVIYEVSNSCYNSIESSSVEIKITTFTQDRFNGYEMYLNNDNTYKVNGNQISTTEYSYSFDITKLTNGVYDSFYIENNNGDVFSMINAELFFYVDNSIKNMQLLNTTFSAGKADQFILLEFANDITYIKSVRLTDQDTEIEVESEKYVNPSCNKYLSNNTMICNFDMSNYFGYEYAVSFISDCNDGEFITGLKVSPEPQPTFFTIEPTYYVINTVITVVITPKPQGAISNVQLVNVNDNSIIINIDNYEQPKKNYITFSSGNEIGNYKVKADIGSLTVESEEIVIIEHKIELKYNEIYLPNEDRNIDILTVPLINSIILDQIEYINFDDNLIDVASYGLSSDNSNILISFSPANNFQLIEDHTIEIKDKSQKSSVIYTIHIVVAPTIDIYQTLFIVDSPYKETNITVSNLNNINLINIFVRDESTTPTSYSPLDIQYKYLVDTSNSKVISFSYKVEDYGDYYYNIQTQIHIVNAYYKDLFQPVLPCNFLNTKEFSIDLSLLSHTSEIVQDDIQLKVYKINIRTPISFEKDATSYVYRNTNIDYANYKYYLVYQNDQVPFYSNLFSLTSFDRTRWIYNYARDPFIIDFNDMLCDDGITQLTLTDSSLNIPLSCSYDDEETLLCELASSSDVSKLLEQEYDVYNQTNLFHHIKLVKCEKPTEKFDRSNGDCLSSCKLNTNDYIYTYNDECVASCPSGAGLINSFCIDDFVIFSEDDSTIKISGDLGTLANLLLSNIDDFKDFAKTIISDEFAVQLFELGNPINDPSFSIIDTDSIEKELNSDSPLYMLKVDTFTNDSVTNKVDYSVVSSEGETIDKKLYQNASVQIQYPINENMVDLSKGEYFNNQGIDVFDASDAFFNDICYPYTSDKSTDVILADRRTDIYQNVSFCGNLCLYKGINYTTKSVICDCDIILEGENETTNEKDFDANEFTADIFSSNIAIMRCMSMLSGIKMNNIGFIIMTVFIAIMVVCSALFVTKDFISLKVKINQHLVNQPPIKLNETEHEELYHNTTDFTYHKRSVNKYRNRFENVVGNPKDINNYPFKQAIKFDNRSYINMLWAMYVDKEDMWRMCYPSSIFECLTITINFLLFKFCLDFTLNCIFFTDDQLSSRYHNGTLTFLQDLLRSIPSIIISAIISSIFSSFVSYPPMIEMLLFEIRTKKIIQFIHKLYKSMIIKFIMFHLLLLVLFIFSLCYLSLFCIVYNNSQTSWFTGCIYSVITSVVVNIAISILLVSLRKFALIYKKEYPFNLHILIKRLIS